MTYRLELNQGDHKQLLSDFLQVCHLVRKDVIFATIII